MIEVQFTQTFKKQALKLSRKDQRLQQSLNKQFALFVQNQSHPSLKTHYLQGKRSTQLSIWIQNNLRAVGTKEKNVYIFFELINHDQYSH